MPLRLPTVGVFDAVLANVAEAEAAPVALGANFTVKVTGWVVVTVTGNVRPLIENSEGLAPLKLTEDTDTLAPLALSVPVCVPLVPTTTLPTLTEPTANVPRVGVTEDPVKPMLKVGFEAFESIVTLPGKLPADCGVRVTVKDALCPGVKVSGVDIPEMLKPVPAAVA